MCLVVQGGWESKRLAPLKTMILYYVVSDSLKSVSVCVCVFLVCGGLQCDSQYDKWFCGKCWSWWKKNVSNLIYCRKMQILKCDRWYRMSSWWLLSNAFANSVRKGYRIFYWLNRRNMPLQWWKHHVCNLIQTQCVVFVDWTGYGKRCNCTHRTFINHKARLKMMMANPWATTVQRETWQKPFYGTESS